MEGVSGGRAGRKGFVEEQDVSFFKTSKNLRSGWGHTRMRAIAWERAQGDPGEHCVLAAERWEPKDWA